MNAMNGQAASLALLITRSRREWSYKQKKVLHPF